MITLYKSSGHSLTLSPEEDRLPADVVWIDMQTPSGPEEQQLEALVNLDLPTREDLQEIEPSNRLYREDGAVFLTASVICRSESRRPQTADVAFILCADKLITIRYGAPKAFNLFATQLPKHQSSARNGLTTLVNLLEAVIDRTADVLEKVGHELDEVPDRIFQMEDEDKARRTADELEEILTTIQSLQRIAAKVRESLVSLGRMTGFLMSLQDLPFDGDLRARGKSIARDIASLSDHASYISSNISFLLDASLGLINIEQNAIIKFFSVVAVVLLPPTLVASIYGMNFQYIPELHWRWGYPVALVVMVLSAVLPYMYFSKRGWL